MTSLMTVVYHLSYFTPSFPQLSPGSTKADNHRTWFAIPFYLTLFFVRINVTVETVIASRDL